MIEGELNAECLAARRAAEKLFYGPPGDPHRPAASL